jgi:HSP20 family protein
MRSLLPFGFGSTSIGSSFADLQKEIEKTFENFRATLPAAGGEAGLLAPKVDFCETDEGYEMTAEVPGVEEKDIDVQVTDHAITIRAEKKSEIENKNKTFHVIERSYGAFYRSMALPDDVDPDKVEAHFENGLLTISIAKSAEAKTRTRKVQIKGAH